MKLKRILIFCVWGLVMAASVGARSLERITPGQEWPDRKGEHINAHGGGLLFHEGKYYWYGENRPARGFTTEVGVEVYSSSDLVNWEDEGVALAVSEESGHDIERGCIMERPKVVRNPKTGKFVMLCHLELIGKGFAAARVGFAESDSPVGPFRFIRSLRPNAFIWPTDFSLRDIRKAKNLKEADYKEWWTPMWYEAIHKGLFVKRDLQGGQMARDMQLFVDEDGKAYHIYSSEDNLTLQIAELSDDYLSHTGKYVRMAPAGHNEAPAIFKKSDGTYWMITSGCTGWDPNEARMFSAPSIWGPWTQHPNPCRGEKSEITFGGQSTYVLPVPGKKDAFIFMADIWRPKHPSDARYIWLPVQFENGVPYIEWMDSWTLDFFNKK